MTVPMLTQHDHDSSSSARGSCFALSGVPRSQENAHPLGPAYGPSQIAIPGSQGYGRFLMSEKPLHCGSMVGSIKNAGALQLRNAADTSSKNPRPFFSRPQKVLLMS